VDISELICEVIHQYQKIFGGGAPKTKLLKLVYLTEIVYKRRYNERLTNAQWVYYLYGPYLSNYDDILQEKNINIEKHISDDGKEPQILSLANTYNNENAKTEIRLLINRILSDYGKLDLRDLLDYVYFETEPMMNAENRGEPLDFNTIMPEDYYKVKELKINPSEEKKLRREFREKVGALRGKRDT
jgi:uncharacterized phage-associated protein